MFDWYVKKRLAEQIKFFGGKQKKFISVYAKQVKPRIRMKNKELVRFNLMTNYANSALAAQQQAVYMADQHARQGAQLANLQTASGVQLLGMRNCGMGGNGALGQDGGLMGMGQGAGMNAALGAGLPSIGASVTRYYNQG